MEMDAFIAAVKASVAADAVAQKESPVEDAMAIWSVDLVYGELQPHSVAALLDVALPLVETARTRSKAPPSPDAPTTAPTPPTEEQAGPAPLLAFLDLGSGEGVPCIVAAASHPHAWRRLLGVELVPRLATLAGAHLAAAVAAAPTPAAADALRRVAFTTGDMLAPPPEDDWFASADVVFANATCYGDETLRSLFARAEALRPGAVLILTSHKLPSHLFELCHEATLDATWGSVTARIYRRSRMPKWVAGVFRRH